MRAVKAGGSWFILQQFTGKNLRVATNTFKYFVLRNPFEANLAVRLFPFKSVHYSTNSLYNCLVFLLKFFCNVFLKVNFANEFTSKTQFDIPSIADLENKTYDEVNELFTQTKILDAEDLVKTHLKGLHLYASVRAYEHNLLSNGTTQTARKALIDALMKKYNVTHENIAIAIADWLIKLTYTDETIVRNIFKLFAKECRSAYINVNKKLKNASSESEKELLLQNGKKIIDSLRFSFYNHWNYIFRNFALPFLDESILNGISTENLLSMTSIRNDATVKKLLQQFYREPIDITQQIPLLVINESIKIQFLSLLDSTHSNQGLFNYSTKSFSIAIAPSGCGKTHEILKYGHSKFCLFFNGSLPGDSDLLQLKTNEFGFKDESVAYLEYICALYCRNIEANHFVTNFVVEYFTSVLILSRLVYLDFLKTTFQSKMTPVNFLLSQLNRNSIVALRIFKKLISSKLNYAFVLEKIRYLQERYDVFAVLDEANVLTSTTIATRIVPYNFSNEDGPFLASVANTLIDNLNYVVFAGTALELTTAVTILSGIGKELEHPLYFSAKFKRSKEEIMSVFNQVINIDGCESIIEKHSSYLCGGRIRLFMRIVALLPQYLKEGLAKSTQFEEATIHAIFIIRNNLKHAIDQKFNKSSQLERSTIIDTLIEYFIQFTTVGYHEKNSQNVNLDLVNFGICELVTKPCLNNQSPI